MLGNNHEFFIFNSSKDEIDFLINMNFGANDYSFNLRTEYCDEIEGNNIEINNEDFCRRLVGFNFEKILHDKNTGTWLIKDRTSGTVAGGITCLKYPKGFQITFITYENYQEKMDQFSKVFAAKAIMLGYSIEEVSQAVEVIHNGDPWDSIPDHNWDREAVKLWWEGFSGKEIALKVGCNKERVHNRLCELRKIHDVNIVPTDEMRRRIHLSR